MINDVEPKIVKADKRHTLILEVSKLSHLWAVHLASGIPYSVEWTDKELERFLPNQKVSTMLDSWEIGLQRELEIAEKAVATGVHPTWTKREKVMVEYAQIPGHTRWNGNYIDAPYQMNKSEIASWEVVVERLKAKQGKLQWVKIEL